MASDTSYGFVIFSQDGCSYCTRAKQLLIDRGYAYSEINLSEIEAHEKQEFLARFAPIDRTVPKIYYDGVLIGGFGDLEDFFDNPIAAIFLQYATPEPIYAERLSPTAILPTRGSKEAIALDLYADLGIGESLIIPPNEVKKIPLGWALKAPRNHYLRIAPRSGLALKAGIDPLGGVVDRDYTGELAAILVTHNYENVTIKHGDRVAQLIAERASIVPVVEVPKLPSTERGGGAYGSTGK
jgi:dUTP pyrophosphatase